MTYLFLGNDPLAKDEFIDNLKKKIFPLKDSLQFDSITLHGKHLNSEDLKKNLIALPALSKKRLIVIRNIEKLNPHNKNLILEFAQSKQDYAVLVLDSEEEDLKTSFLKKVSSFSEIVRFKTEIARNVFDMTNAISRHDPVEALKVLNELESHGVHPLQIMGGLVWFWGKNKNRLSTDRFHQGLSELQTADLNIKRSRIKSEYALELLVTKLCSLTA